MCWWRAVAPKKHVLDFHAGRGSPSTYGHGHYFSLQLNEKAVKCSFVSGMQNNTTCTNNKCDNELQVPELKENTRIKQSDTCLYIQRSRGELKRLRDVNGSREAPEPSRGEKARRSFCQGSGTFLNSSWWLSDQLNLTCLHSLNKECQRHQSVSPSSHLNRNNWNQHKYH